MRLHFSMSEAQADMDPGWAQRELTLDTDGEVQLTYQTLRDSTTSAAIAVCEPDSGMWRTERDACLYSDIVICNPTAPEVEHTELVKLAEELAVDEDALDEHVHDLASRHSSAVNNEGLASQIAYLIAELGPAAAGQLLAQVAQDGHPRR